MTVRPIATASLIRRAARARDRAPWLPLWHRLHDIAVNRRLARERLQAQSALLQSTLESMGEGLSVFDRQGRLVAWNARFGELLELTTPLTTDTTLGELLAVQARRGDFGPVDPDREVALRLARIYHEVPTSCERTMPSGRILRLRRNAMPDGGIVTAFSDVTEIMASEREMQEARRQAERANHAKSEFLANMSHELRTPLNAIIGFSELISNEFMGPMADGRYLEYVKDIHASGLHLLSIINDVLDMSKIEAGKMELAAEPVSLTKIIGEAVRIVQERAQSRGLVLAVEVPAEEIVIQADERAMKQILLNILSNAIKFSHEAGRVAIRATVAGGDRILVEITDHGIGMNEEEQERALQPFGQAKSVVRRVHGGTGLGLTITKGLVEAHGGHLAIDSAPERGTTVRIDLPALSKRAEPLRG